MFPSNPTRAIWIWLVIAAVFVGRFEGAHLHLCFDGLEPPATVHVADGAAHDDAHHVDTEHDDRDVDLLGATLLKKSDSGLDLQLLFVASVLFYLPVAAQPLIRPSTTVHLPTWRLLYFDPPPRGPPR